MIGGGTHSEAHVLDQTWGGTLSNSKFQSCMGKDHKLYLFDSYLEYS